MPLKKRLSKPYKGYTIFVRNRFSCGNEIVLETSTVTGSSSHTNTLLFAEGDSLPNLIARAGIETHFHVVSSVRRACVVGMEALSRGVGLDGKLIAPLPLFAEAERLHLTCELDRACQRAAFAAFAPLHRADTRLMLFVNLHPDCIADALSPNLGLIALAKEFDIAPRFVVVEILETALDETKHLREAINLYRDEGFLVALDDVGAGDSSLNRILSVRPDILKTDRSLIENIENDFYKQQIYKAVLQMGEKLGGWVITEGVEKEAESLVALGLGADLFQGFYFNKPRKMDGSSAGAAQSTTQNLQADVSRLRETGRHFKQETLGKLRDEKTRRSKRRETTKAITRTLQAGLNAAAPPQGDTLSAYEIAFLEALLKRAIVPHSAVQSASLLDQSGTQITDTLLHPEQIEKRKQVMYPPSPLGTNHALKEYFYVLMETTVDRYETQPYVPLPTSDICITASERTDRAGTPLVLCLHLFVAHADPSPNSPVPLQ